MKIAALYDIHGNLPALDAVLHEIAEEGVDEIVVGGDVVPGPMPAEALDRLRAVGIPTRFILGNGEVAILSCRAGRGPGDGVPEQAWPVVEWAARKLTADHERWIAGWPKLHQTSIPGVGEVLFCHATPRNENDIFTRSTPEAALRSSFAGLEVDVVVCGHTHMVFDRQVGKIRVVNAGSVGMPFGRPGADWLLLGTEIEPRHTAYDLENATAQIRESDYPQAAQLGHTLLQPPTEEEIFAHYSKVGLR